MHSASVRCKALVCSLQISVKSEVCSDRKKCASGVEITRNPRKNFTKELQIFRNFGAPRAQNSHFSASMRCANRMTSLKLLTGFIVRSDPKKQARGVEITQILCENLAKELQNFRNFGAPCAERIACTRPAFAAQNIATSLQLLNKLEVCFRSEKVRVWRRSHEKFAQKMPKIPRKKCKTSGISACRSQKNYVQSASVRFASLVISLQLSLKSKICSDPKKCASGVEITRNPRKRFTKELQFFWNSGAPRAQNSFFLFLFFFGQHAQ